MDNDQDKNAAMSDKKDGGDGRPKKHFGGRKVCPFVADKTLIIDYKSFRVMRRFISETGKIVPRHVSGVGARSQRALTKHIKRARNIGFLAPASE